MAPDPHRSWASGSNRDYPICRLARLYQPARQSRRLFLRHRPFSLPRLLFFPRLVFLVRLLNLCPFLPRLSFLLWPRCRPLHQLALRRRLLVRLSLVPAEPLPGLSPGQARPAPPWLVRLSVRGKANPRSLLTFDWYQIWRQRHGSVLPLHLVARQTHHPDWHMDLPLVAALLCRRGAISNRPERMIERPRWSGFPA